jgi:membrane protein
MSTRLRQFRNFLQHDLWRYETQSDADSTPFRIVLLRVLNLAWEGLIENQLFTRAAALSYSALIGMGPLIAIIVLISGTYLKEDAEQRLKEGLLFIAPSLSAYVTVENTVEMNPGNGAANPEAINEAEPGAGAGTAAGAEAVRQSELDRIISQIIQGSETTLGKINTKGRSWAGIIGVFTLIFIGIQLLISIERTFNSIWGVKRGRDWTQRIVFYWTFITLGFLLGLGSTALLSASALTGMFEWLPFGATVTALFVFLSPVLSIVMLVLLLTFVYQFFPNTTVNFRPAFIGALTVAVILVAHNYLSILYVNYVIRMQSLYGSLGILLVMMAGLYSFWIFILFGAQITYAIQNVQFLTNREVWREISIRTQEAVTLAAWLSIARSFADCAPAPTASALSEKLRVPGNVVNSSLSILTDNGWVVAIRESDDDGLEQVNYRPAKPLERYSLRSYRETFHDHGNSRGADFVAQVDPLMEVYAKVNETRAEEDAEIPFDDLLNRYPARAG